MVLTLALVGTTHRTSETQQGNIRDFRSDELKRVPTVVLWAWERRENLSFIDPRRIAVAYLAATLKLRGDDVLMRPRFQPLRMPPRTTLLAVVRLETDRRRPPSLSSEQAQRAALNAASVIDRSASALQIDFDATRSERAFYRVLLTDLRARLPPSMPLSIAALASWCLDDDWIKSLPVDQAVPMLYRMGRERDQVLAFLRSGGQFQPQLCRRSVGLSLDEALSGLGRDKQVFLFAPQPWNAATFQFALQRIAQ